MQAPALHLGALHHAGMVVPDLDAALAGLTALAAGPVHRFAGRYPADVGGEDIPIVVTGGFLRLGGTLLEVLQPLDDRSPIAAWLERHPAGGLHHLAHVVDDLAAARGLIAAGRLRLVIDACRPGDGSDWIYAEDPAGGLILELVARGPGSEAFFGEVARGLGEAPG